MTKNYYQKNKEKYLERANEWAKNNPEKRRKISREWARKNRKEHPEKYKEKWKNEYQKYKGRIQDRKGELRQERRFAVINHYTNGTLKCSCGYSDVRALQVDHINDDGAEHRRKVGDIYRDIIKNDYPPNFQILCANCNRIKEMERLGFYNSSFENSIGQPPDPQST